MKSLFALTIESVLSDVSTQSVLEIFDKIGIGSWLQKHPFQKLSFEPVVLIAQREVNGSFDYQNRIAQVSTQRPSHAYGQILIWGQTDKLSQTAKTLEEAVGFTLLHESGHHIHAALRDVDKFQFGLTLRAIRTNAVSNYAKTPNAPLEYFAETFVAWVLYRTDLIINDTFGYAMIDKALKTLGIEVKE